MILILILAAVFYYALYSALRGLFSKASGGNDSLAKILAIVAIVIFLLIYSMTQ